MKTKSLFDEIVKNLKLSTLDIKIKMEIEKLETEILIITGDKEKTKNICKKYHHKDKLQYIGRLEIIKECLLWGGMPNV